jgi:cell division protein FtsL
MGLGMNDTQILTIALASVPTTLAVLIGILYNNYRLNDTNAHIADLNSRIIELRSDMNTRIIELRSDMNMRFTSMDRRFDEMKDLW